MFIVLFFILSVGTQIGVFLISRDLVNDHAYALQLVSANQAVD
jgi:hypothetical protein